MAKRLTTVGALFALLLSMLVSVYSVQQQAAHAEVGFEVNNGRLYDANGNRFIIRGVSHPQEWFPNETQAYADIASLGANTVRVVLGAGVQWGPTPASEVSNVIAQCKQNQLVCILEVHDTTGYGEDSAAATLDQAVDYWISIQDALQGEEEYVLINIGNEPYGNGDNTSEWTSATIDAIQRMRSAGFDHTLTVNGPNWGQDWEFIMRDNAQQVYNADPAGNTMFGIHMYGVFDTASAVNDYLNSFVDRGLPIFVGEFGHNHSDGDPAEDAIMSTTESLDLGYVGWSWSGNSGGVEYLDMVNDFNVSSLTSWGDRIFNGANGIASTAEVASVYDGSGEDPPGGEDPPPGGDGDCVVDYTVQNQWGSGFTANVEITNNGSAVQSWELGFEFSAGQSVTNGWHGNYSQSGSSVTVSNASWNGSVGSGQTVSIGFNASHSGSNPDAQNFTFNGTSCTTG